MHLHTQIELIISIFLVLLSSTLLVRILYKFIKKDNLKILEVILVILLMILVLLLGFWDYIR